MIGVKQISALYPTSPCIKEKRWRKCTRLFQDSLSINLLSEFMFSQDGPLEKEMGKHCSILPRESHGQKSLAGHSPWGRKESDTTEWPNTTHRMDLSSIKNFSVSAYQTVNIHFWCAILYYFYKVLKVTFRQNSKLSYCIWNTVLEVLSSNCQSWLSHFDANICEYIEL